MNKISFIAAGVIIALSSIGAAHADYSWTGFYAGVNAGMVFDNAQLKSRQLGFTDPSESCDTSSDYSTFSPGIQLGYLYQLPNYFVSGIEANITINTKQKETISCNCTTDFEVSDRFKLTNEMQSSFKGRVGRAINWNSNILLPYLTAGVDFATLGLKYKNEGGDSYSTRHTQAGWLIGAGMEWAFRENWSLRGEYYYANYGSAIKLKIPSVYGLEDPNGGGHVDLSSNTVAVAINYRI